MAAEQTDISNSNGQQPKVLKRENKCAMTKDAQLNALVMLHLKITFSDEERPTVLSFVPVTMTFSFPAPASLTLN